MAEFNPGDRVRVSFITTYIHRNSYGRHVVEHPITGGEFAVEPGWLSALGPEYDTPGTVRQAPDGRIVIKAYISDDGCWVRPGDKNGVGGWYLDSSVKHWKVVFTPESVTPNTSVDKPKPFL